MKYKKLITFLLIASALLALIFYNATSINPKQLTIRLETIDSQKIDAAFNDFTITFFADLHYREGLDERLKEVCQTINETKPDLILFGGDLIDHFSGQHLSDSQRLDLTEQLKSLEAPYGKYAVLGNHDLAFIREGLDLAKVLKDADFILLNNEMAKIYHQSGAYFQLVGIESMILGNADVLKSFEEVNDQLFTLTLTHTPDTFDRYKARSDYALSGHSHGGQIYLPFITKFFLPEGAKEYVRGKVTSEGSILDITNGIGTTKKDIRLNADAEIVVYRLKNN